MVIYMDFVSSLVNDWSYYEDIFTYFERSKSCIRNDSYKIMINCVEHPISMSEYKRHLFLCVLFKENSSNVFKV